MAADVENGNGEVAATGKLRRRSSDHGLFSDLPLWSRIIATVGIPGAIAFFLVYVLSGTLPSIQAELAAERLLADKNHELLQHISLQIEELYRLEQRMCSNVAKTQEERQRCFDR